MLEDDRGLRVTAGRRQHLVEVVERHHDVAHAAVPDQRPESPQPAGGADQGAVGGIPHPAEVGEADLLADAVAGAVRGQVTGADDGVGPAVDIGNSLQPGRFRGRSQGRRPERGPS